MPENETRYLLASIGILLGSVVFFGVSFRRRAVTPWPKGAELQIVDWLMLTAGILTFLAALFGILGTLDDAPGVRDWPSSLRGTGISTLLLASMGFLWQFRRGNAESSTTQ